MATVLFNLMKCREDTPDQLYIYRRSLFRLRYAELKMRLLQSGSLILSFHPKGTTEHRIQIGDIGQVYVKLEHQKKGVWTKACDLI